MGAERVVRVGRPRAVPWPAGADPREDLLRAAAELFTTVGYGATTTKRVAEAAGLRQASLFHYFARKDDLFAELLDRTLAPALELADALDCAPPPPDVFLYALVRWDTENLCSGPYNLGALQLLPEARAERFAFFWEKRRRLWNRYSSLLRSGAKEGMFDVSDVPLATDLVFGLVESVLTWYDRAGRRTVEEASVAIADLCLRGVLAQPRRLRTVAGRAEALLLTARR